MNALKSTLQSITYIITGELLQLAGSISDTWVATFVTLFGIGLFFNGLSKLKSGLDETGKSGVQWLVIASIVAFIAAILSFIPLIGVLSALLFSLSFVLHIVGFVKLRHSNSIGDVGKSGINLLFAAMGFAIIANILGILPLVGNTMGGLMGFGAIVCALFGWLRLQEGLIEQNTVSLSATTL
jgi:hypothetical protein